VQQNKYKVQRPTIAGIPDPNAGKQQEVWLHVFFRELG